MAHSSRRSKSQSPAVLPNTVATACTPSAAATPTKGSRRRVLLEDWLRVSPFCTADWRWKACQRYLMQPLPLPTRDATLLRLRRRMNRPAGQVPRDEELDQAIALHTAGGDQKAEIEARLLTRADLPAIAGKMALAVPVVALYHDVFFDVGPRFGAIDWMVIEAVRIGPWFAPEPDEAAIWRHVAWICPAALDALIADHRHAATAAQRQQAEFIRLHCRVIFTAMGHPAFTKHCKAMIKYIKKEMAVNPDSPLGQSLPQLRFVLMASQWLPRPSDSPRPDRRRPSRKDPPNDPPTSPDDDAAASIRVSARRRKPAPAGARP